MKTNAMNKLLIALLAIWTLMSCSSDDTTADDLETVTMTEEEAALEAKTEGIEGTTFDLVEQLFVEVEESTAKTFPACATITAVLMEGMREVTLDFGDGCELSTGDVAAGKLIISFEPDPGVSRTITFTFDQFSLNDNAISGGGQVVRLRENENGNPQSTYNSRIEIDFTNSDVVVTREVQHKREWIEGRGTGAWSDNVFEVTGQGSTVTNTGFSRSHEITAPLVRLGYCGFFVSGEVLLSRNDNRATLDFGDGDCDNKALLTYEGGSMEITLTR